MLESRIRFFRAAIEQVASESAMPWLDEAGSCLEKSDEIEQALLTCSAAARRRLGLAPMSGRIALTGEECDSLDLSCWTVADAARALLLLQAISVRPARAGELARSLFRHGDEAERAAVVRSLVLLPEAQALRDIALEAGRANSQRLFAAIALDNPFPAAYYHDDEFNQLVLKSAFMSLPLGSVLGLSRRANAELSRMCEDYLDERVAAGRTVPTDLWLALAPFASARGEKLMVAYASDADPRHRQNALVGLIMRRETSPYLEQVIRARATAETDPCVTEILRRHGYQ
jgi:hypothetical protein